MKPHAQVLRTVSAQVSDYLEGLDARGIGAALAPSDVRTLFDLTLSAEARSPEALAQTLEAYLKHSVGTLHPSFMNQLFSGLRPWALGGELAALATNTTMATFEAAPVATLMERELIQLLGSYVGWDTTDGIMVTGGSNANLVALLMARNALHPEIRTEGASPRPLIAYVSAEAHYSYAKAINVLGLGEKNLRMIDADAEGRMDPDALARAIAHDRAAGRAPFFIGATAGTTVLGAFDPINRIAPVAQREKLWLHVDGAWGGSVLVSATHRHLMDGIAAADSLGWDHHKMLATGLVSSFFLTKHVGELARSHRGGGSEYIFHASDAESVDTGPSSLQCGRRADAVKTWFAWAEAGTRGMESSVDQLMARAQTCAELLRRDPRFELIHAPQSLNVCFKLRAAGPGHTKAWYQALRQRLMARGEYMVNIATRADETFVRLILAHPGQDEAFLRRFLERLAATAEEL